MAFIECNFFSETLQRTVTFNAIIPADKGLFADRREAPTGFDSTRSHRPQNFKTLYLLHGGLGNHTDWVNGTRIHMWAQEKDLAVIMPAGDNRSWIDDPSGSALLGQYGQYVGRELVQFTRNTFPLSPRREDTFVAGLSMGGFGALVNGLRFPEVFSRIAALSPGLLYGDLIPGYDDLPNEDLSFAFGDSYRDDLRRVLGNLDAVVGSNRDYKGMLATLKRTGADIPGIFLACGESDIILNRSQDFHRYLNKLEVDHHYEEGPGGHDWTFWDGAIKKVLDWLPLSETAQDGRHSGNVVVSRAS
ncbi:alpha/beta hydrolase-fold protein [Micrococcaceae bacterium Sec5.1]